MLKLSAFLVLVKIFCCIFAETHTTDCSKNRYYVKNILIAMFMAVAGMFVPCSAEAVCLTEMEMIDNNDLSKITISVNESVLRVTGAAGMTMSVYNITGGVPVMKVKIDGPDKRFDLNLPRGIYIVQVGKAVRKIVIK